jgi:hypothetical protein
LHSCPAAGAALPGCTIGNQVLPCCTPQCSHVLIGTNIRYKLVGCCAAGVQRAAQLCPTWD